MSWQEHVAEDATHIMVTRKQRDREREGPEF